MHYQFMFLVKNYSDFRYNSLWNNLSLQADVLRFFFFCYLNKRYHFRCIYRLFKQQKLHRLVLLNKKIFSCYVKLENLCVWIHIIEIFFINKYKSNAMIKFVISFCTSEYNVYPNTHSFRAGCHKMIKSRWCLDDKREGWLWRSDGVHMVHIDFFDRLEVNYTASFLGRVIAVVR